MHDSTTIPTPLKRCTMCDQLKPASTEYFCATKWNKIGLEGRCRDCKANRETQRRLDPSSHNPPMSEGCKRCISCKEVKPYEAFAGDKHHRDGRQNQCRLCRKAYHEANRGTILAKKKLYYIEHREAVIEGVRSYTLANLGKVKAYRKAFWTANPDKRRAKEHMRRTRIIGNGGHFTDKDVANMQAIQQGHCAYCSRIGIPLTIEHIIPVVRGGPSDHWNLCLACQRCNSSKGDKLLEEWVYRWYLEKD